MYNSVLTYTLHIPAESWLPYVVLLILGTRKGWGCRPTTRTPLFQAVQDTSKAVLPDVWHNIAHQDQAITASQQPVFGY